MVGFNRRFDPNFAALKAAAEGGEIGKSELLSITSFDPAPPPISYVKVSGGLFRDMMIHDFDLACWIMGASPDQVTAVGTSIVDPAIGAAGDVDTAVVTLLYGDGRIASHQEQPARRLRLRSAHRTSGLQGPALGGQRAREHGLESDGGTASWPPSPSFSFSSATCGPTAPNGRLSSMR